MAWVFELRSRSLCTSSSSKWRVKQVTTSNFQESLQEIKTHISNSDFVAISMGKTGSPSAPSWLRPLPFDTAQTAYSKARRAAQRFQLLHFAVCPFSVSRSDKLLAHPYNFMLFPRDEMKMGMPTYSFSCQTSLLASMARQGFDFNACVYNGISYLSRAQESAARIRLGTALPSLRVMKSSSPSTVADTVFVERIRSKVKYWRESCKSSDTNKSRDEELVNSLRNIVLGNEQFRSRPCMTVDVCSERQVQLILEMVLDYSDDLLPLPIPTKSGTIHAVRIVLANSKEDKDLLERELRNLEEEESKKIRGFREVIDLISASQKPVISHNCLNDCTLIHSKFIAPLPPEIDEFVSSLCSVFPEVLDINYLMKKHGTMRKVTNIPSAISYLNNHFFAPVDLEIPDQGQGHLWMVNKTPGSATWDLASRSHQLWKTLVQSIEEQGLDPMVELGWKQSGSLLIGRTDAESDVLKGRVKLLCEAGLKAEYLCSSDLIKEEPDLLVDKDSAAAFLPDDCQIDAYRTVAYIEKTNRSFASKGRYTEFYDDPVKCFIRSDSNGEVKAVQTSKNTIYSKKAVIVAAGCWTGSLMQDLFRNWGMDLHVPVMPRKGHLLVVQNFNFLQMNHGLMEADYLNHPTISGSESPDHQKNLSVSMVASIDAAGNLLLGSSREFVGFNTNLDESVVSYIWKRVGEFFPKLKTLPLSDLSASRKVRIGLRPYMPNGKPVIGPVPGLSNVYLAAGHEGSGLLMALGTAEMIVEMVLGYPAKVDSTPFAVQKVLV